MPKPTWQAHGRVRVACGRCIWAATVTDIRVGSAAVMEHMAGHRRRLRTIHTAYPARWRRG